ncbi:MAG: FAD-dependent oxidoreductase, partial [Culicoidibacterales bacterium]
ACGILGEIFAQAVRDGVLTSEDIRYIQGFTMPTKPGCLSFNGPQIPKSDRSQTPMALSSYVSQGREMQQRLWQFLRQTIPGFEKSFIAQEARMLGIRESYRIHGKYELSADDYRNRQKFEDGIARGDWYIDIHRDDESVEDPSFKAKYAPGEYYEIPYRSLVIEAFANYIAVGRHISCDFAMQSSIRIQATCQMMGEAAGIATKISKTEQIQLNQIDGQKIKKILEENQA